MLTAGNAQKLDKHAGDGDAHLGAVTPLTSMCLMPPSIKTQLWFLVFTVYKVEGLPSMDAGLLTALGLKHDSIDCFVKVKFGGLFTSRHVSAFQPTWLEGVL